MKKTTKDGLIKRAQVKDIRVKATFTLDADTYSKFQAECEKSKVAMSRVLEAFMSDFIKGDN